MRQSQKPHLGLFWFYSIKVRYLCYIIIINKRTTMAAVKASIGEPAELNLTHWRNDSIDDFEIEITHKSGPLKGQVVDLSIYDEVLMQIKRDTESTSSEIEFSRAASSILWSVDAGGIETGDGSDGIIVLRANMTAMEALGDGEFVYDIQFTNTTDSKRNTFVFGTIVVKKDRSR